MAGYSATPLARKLGIKGAQRLLLVGAPEHFEASLAPLPEGTRRLTRGRGAVDVIVCFCPDGKALKRRLVRCRSLMKADAGLWLAWPKKSSPLHRDLDFSVVQGAGLSAGLVDNKVCAIDEDWSGLRFVVRKEDRASWSPC